MTDQTDPGSRGNGTPPTTSWIGEVTTGQGFAGLAYVIGVALSGGGMSRQQVCGLLAGAGVSLLWQEGKTNSNILDLFKKAQAQPRSVAAMIMLLLAVAGAGGSLTSSVINSGASTDNTRSVVAQFVPVSR